MYIEVTKDGKAVLLNGASVVSVEGREGGGSEVMDELGRSFVSADEPAALVKKLLR